MQTRWTVVFIDHPGTTSDVAASFWAAVSGSTRSAPRGDNGEFVTFEPKDGADPHLRLQRTDAVEAGTHLDIYVDDVASAVAEIVDSGGRVAADHGWYSVVTSPGGMRFCVVPAKGQSRRQAPVTDASGQTTLVDQISIDVDAAHFEAEVRFWSIITNRPAESTRLDEFMVIGRPADLPWRFLLQRRAERNSGVPSPTSLHLDIACDSVAAARDVHVGLGATVVEEFRYWTVMADPAGAIYCLTSRNPLTGTLPPSG